MFSSIFMAEDYVDYVCFIHFFQLGPCWSSELSRRDRSTQTARGEAGPADRLATVPLKEAEVALKSLGMSEKGMEKDRAMTNFRMFL